MTSAFSMIDVGAKPVTRRVAAARGEIQLSEKVRAAIEQKKVPKGDVLSLAEIAGINAAKRTSDILPLCHPLALDSVLVQCEVDAAKNRVLISATVTAHGRTGVEMEALSAVSAALLCVYDLTKGLDRGAVISGIMLEHKSGGKSGEWRHANGEHSTPAVKPELQGVRAAVLTVSDRCSSGESADESGVLLAEFLKKHGAELADKVVVPDEAGLIKGAIENFVLKQELDLILVTGGTGIGPRDVTPDALKELWTKPLPGFGELIRSRGLLNTERAWLSRAEAGLVQNTLVVLMPGSPSAVRDGLAILDTVISHMFSMIRGGKH